VTVTPNPVLGGVAATGKVTLTAITPSDMIVTLGSSNTAAATVPGSVTVKAGTSSATFPVTTFAQTAPVTTLITAATATATRKTTLTVQSVGAVRLSFSPNPVVGGNAATGTVTLNGTAAADLVVTLTSSNTGVATVPANVTVKAGSKTATFPITTFSVLAT